MLLLIATIALVGCARPGDHPSSSCVWSEADSRSLNPTTISDRRHLRLDADTAEDVAIGWADTRFYLRPEYEQRRDECMQTLFQGIADKHGVEVAIVRQYSAQRDVVADAVGIFSFAILYVFVAYVFTGRIRRRFPTATPASG